MQDFDSISRRAQIERLRKALINHLGEFGLSVGTLKLVNHEFNTTFRLEATNGSAYAVRMNVNSVHSEPEIRAEVEWVESIARNSSVWVPIPRRTADNEPYARVSLQGLEQAVPVIVYEWLPGHLAVGRRSMDTYKKTGEAMRGLHAHARSFQVTPPAYLKLVDDPLCGAPHHFRRFSEFEATYDRIYQEAKAVLAKLMRIPPHPIHFDIHFYNVMVHEGRVAIFDFDDCMLGWPPLDAAQSILGFRMEKNWKGIQAFLEGLELDLKDYGLTPSDFETLIAVRHLLIANDIIESRNPDLKKYALPYMAVGKKRLDHYFSTGVFDPRVAKIQE